MLHLREHKACPNPDRLVDSRLSTLPTHIRTPALGERTLQGIIPQFPLEVLDDILAHLHYDRLTLLNCARTCKTWSKYSFQHIYHTIEISADSATRFPELSPSSGSDPEDAHTRLDKKLERFKNWLYDAEPIKVRYIIRVLRILGVNNGPWSSLDVANCDFFHNLTALLPDLRRLEFHRVYIPDHIPLPLFLFLARFHGISDVRIDRCCLFLTHDWHKLRGNNLPNPVELWHADEPPVPGLTLQRLQLTNCVSGFHDQGVPAPAILLKALSDLEFALPLRQLKISICNREDIKNLAKFLRGSARDTLAHLSLAYHTARGSTSQHELPS